MKYGDEGKPSVDELSQVFSLNWETGELSWRFKGGLVGTQAKEGRLVVTHNQRQYQVSHIVWLFTHGHWPRSYIKYLDGNPRNTRPRNLVEKKPKNAYRLF